MMLASILALILAASPVEAADVDMARREGILMTGGAAISELAKRCDLIDDEYVGSSTGKEARLKIMQCLRGQIAGITYYHVASENMKSVGPSAFGSEYTGPMIGPKLFPPGGEYKTKVPRNFEAGVKKLALAMKQKDVEAGVQIASLYFMDALHSKSMNEAKMFQLFKAAAKDDNHEDAKLMCAVCYYYGIGVGKNRAAANKLIRDWRIINPKVGARDGWFKTR